MSLLKPKSVTKKTDASSLLKPKYAASERQCTAAGREVKVPWGDIHE